MMYFCKFYQKLICFLYFMFCNGSLDRTVFLQILDGMKISEVIQGFFLLKWKIQVFEPIQFNGICSADNHIRLPITDLVMYCLERGGTIGYIFLQLFPFHRLNFSKCLTLVDDYQARSKSLLRPKRNIGLFAKIRPG